MGTGAPMKISRFFLVVAWLLRRRRRPDPADAHYQSYVASDAMSRRQARWNANVGAGYSQSSPGIRDNRAGGKED